MSDCNSCNGDPPKPDFFLVGASPASAAKCGEGKVLGAENQECLIKDSTYDELVAAYTIPAPGTSAPIQVCNPSAYTVGQWIQLVGDGSVLQIISIVGLAVYLKNGCANGAAVKYNSNAGTIIAAKTPFVVVDEPACLTSEEALAEFEAEIAAVTEICTPNLAQEESETAEMQFTGWKRADSGDSGFKKCLKRIKGIWKKKNSVYIKPIETAPSNDINWRPVVINKTTGEVRETLNFAEDVTLTPGQKYVLMVIDGVQALVGPAFVFVPAAANVYRNYVGALNDESLWINIPVATPLSQNISLAIPEIAALNILGTKFYAVLKFNLGCYVPSGVGCDATLAINGVDQLYINGSGRFGFGAITMPIEIDKTLKTLAITVTTKSAGPTPRCHVSVDLIGVYL